MNALIRLSLPLVLSQLVTMALVMTDVWMMSLLGTTELAAGGLGASVYTFVFLLAGSTVGCAANLIAIAYGERQHSPEAGDRKIRETIKGGLMLSLLLSVLLTLSFSLAPDALALAAQPQAAIELAMIYLDPLKWAMLPALLLLVLRGLTSAFGDTRSVLLMSLATVFLNVPISFVLAFGLDWGLAGLGAGTALSTWLVLTGYALWVFARPRYRLYGPWRHWNEYRPAAMLPLLAMGLPIALAAALELSLIYGGTLMAGTISIAALALHQILLQCLSFTWNISFGISQAAAILVGRDHGAGHRPGILAWSRHSLVLISAVSALLALLFVAWPEGIAALFNLDDGQGGSLTPLLASVIWVAALCFVVDAWQLLAINLLRGMKIVNSPTVLTAIGYWCVGLPVAWLLLPSLELVGIWLGIAAGLGATALLLLMQLLWVLSRRHPSSPVTPALA
ncbi:MATE family efflux transporter [Ferrimonas marina]|uniref:Multidrug resistance protein, MATE family n=1 Tax=Ferrimonas marina TaxID=299255 RepID=A0A1M5QYH3_9GAMM|nr:MATE family efflux transporter [Ferrimonas marina]SHH19152.1 multidrug resistance protein, MATE family [Ferrimonas marina]